MGQYYVPTLINKKGKMKTFCSHDYHNGLKLMKHSYIGNNFMASVMHELLDNPHRLWWLGDYAKIKDFQNKDHKLFSRERKKAWSDKYNVPATDDNQKWDLDGVYVINLDKKLFIKINSYDETKWQVNPLSLLTAIGNGKGGGDYNGINMKYVGIWGGDNLVTTFEPQDYINEEFTDVTNKYYFEENYFKEN